MPARIFVVGSCNLDLTFRVPRLPRLGETVGGASLQQGFGGKGANQAVAAACLGAKVTLVACVGNDAFGRQCVENFRARGIDPTFVRTDAGQPTGLASIYVTDAGDNCIVVAAGANAAVTVDDVRSAAASLSQADVVVCQLETPVEAALEAFRIARAAGVRTLLNPAPALPIPDELLRLTDVCVPNETELEMLSGRAESIESAARELRSRGPGTVIVTLGAAGALVVEQAKERVPARPVTAVDPTGAGDVFVAALAVSLAEGRSLRDAVFWANAGAALSVTRPGTQTAAPTRAEVDAFHAAG
jgi:ribokinase